MNLNCYDIIVGANIVRNPNKAKIKVFNTSFLSKIIVGLIWDCLSVTLAGNVLRLGVVADF
jgi:hypothetical protein